MLMIIMWVVLFAALLSFTAWSSYRIGHLFGYGKGTTQILTEWKKSLELMEDVTNGQQSNL